MTVADSGSDPSQRPVERAAQPPRPWLVADIGGTHARFGLVAAGTRAATRVRSLATADHDGPTAAARAYLAAVAAESGDGWEPPRTAAFAVATPVAGDRIAFTNRGAWAFSRAALQRELGLRELVVVNDFEALALALPRLRPEQLRSWPGCGDFAAAAGTLAVVGPGTGLGVAGLVRSQHGFVAVAGEGGHATLAPADDFESELLARVRRSHGHVSAERLLSGIGLPVLHAALADLLGQPLAAGDAPDAAAIVGGSDALATRTVDTFCALLGGFAGSVALTFGARGGLAIGGGIVPRLGDRFFASRFRERFDAKGRFRSYLQAVPTAVVVDTHAALDGAVAALESAAGG